MRTRINGAKIGTVGSVLKTCHGNEPGTLKEVVSLNTAGPCFILLGAPNVLCELGMMGITGSPCISNKAPTVGAGSSASGAGGTGGPGGGGGGAGGGGGNASGPGGPGGGAGGGGSNTGASGPPARQCTQEGHPVDVARGNVLDRTVDLALPGAIPLVWERHYSSARRADEDATLGPGWAHPFEQLLVEHEGTVTLRAEDGRSIYFDRPRPGESVFHRRERLTLLAESDGGYRVLDHASRTERAFLPAQAGGRALLRAIRDPHDDVIALEHQGERLARVVDTAGRELRITWKQARIVRVEIRVDQRLEQWFAYAYTSAGLLASATDVFGHADEYAYDRFGRMISATLENGAGEGVQLWYDDRGNLIRSVDAAGNVTAWEYAGERPTKEISPEGLVTLFTHDAAGALTQMGRPTARTDALGQTMEVSYDRMGRPVAVRRFDRSLAPPLCVRRARPPHRAGDARRRRHALRLRSRGGALLRRARRAPPDDRARPHRPRDQARRGRRPLQRAERLRRHGAPDRAALKAARGAHRELFEYDGAGSIVRMLSDLDGGPEVRERWEVKPGNLLARTPEAKYTHDARHRRTVKLELTAGGARGGAVTEYRWDCRDRLREVKLPSGDVARYTYDAFGRRVRKELLAPGGEARTVHFIWDDQVLAADVDPDRGTRCFVHEPGTWNLLLQQEKREVFTYVNDHLGTPKELLDAGGRVAWSAAHSAFGAVVETYADPGRGRRVDTPFRLLGQYADDETGLCHTRYRFFDPEVGCWVSPDPLGFTGGPNLFGFGSPISDIDPFGLANPMDIGTMSTLTGGSNVNDGQDAHELLQNSWLKNNGVRVGPAFAVQPLLLSQGALPPPGAGSKFRHLHPGFRGPDPETAERVTG